MTTFLAWVIAICFLWLLVKPKNKRAIGSIKELPLIIQPLLESPESFDTSPYSEVVLPLPQTEDSWFSIGRDQELLKEYASRIDSHRLKAENAANAAIRKFEQDHAYLVHQQLQIYRRIYHSKKKFSRFKELKGNKISSKDIPAIISIKIPPKPFYLTTKDLEKKYSINSANAGHALGRLLTANGQINKTNIIATAVATAVLIATYAIKAKANNSKMKRVLEDARGSISLYCKSLKSTVEVLREFHPDLVAVSNKLKASENEIIGIINNISGIPSNANKLNQIPSEMKKHLQTLYFLTLEAEAYSKQRFVNV